MQPCGPIERCTINQTNEYCNFSSVFVGAHMCVLSNENNDQPIAMCSLLYQLSTGSPKDCLIIYMNT